MPSNRCPTCNHFIKRPFSGPGAKLFKTGLWGLIIVLWCVPPENERPLIVSTVLAMEEKQARFWKAVAMVKAKRAEEAKKK